MATKLASWMKEHGVVDETVAKAVGCSRVQINRLRRRKTKPSLELALALEKYTGIPWHEFIHAPAKPKHEAAGAR